ncbi:MAG: TlpA family protein disulfide reductase, partial [Pirellulales bacterium]
YLVHPDSQTKRPDWFYYLEAVSDASGMVRVHARLAQFKSCCLVCRHAQRHLVAVHPIDADHREGAADVTMLPECRVSGTLECKELAGLSRGIGRTHLHLFVGKRIAMEYHSVDGAFHFFLPPGEFSVLITGKDTLDEKRAWSVPPGQTEWSLGVTTVRALPTALLAGKPAPELREVRAWKNTPGVKLADLRGKWVLLEFWGYWCGPCIGRMPELFAAYDEYKDQGLEIIAVHCDGDQDAPLYTAQKLDDKLKDVVKHSWSGRDLPFPVALTSGLVPLFEGGEPTALGPIAADYGITSYPSLVLIDPEGNVVGPVNLRDVKRRLGTQTKDAGSDSTSSWGSK